MYDAAAILEVDFLDLCIYWYSNSEVTLQVDILSRCSYQFSNSKVYLKQTFYTCVFIMYVQTQNYTKSF